MLKHLIRLGYVSADIWHKHIKPRSRRKNIIFQLLVFSQMNIILDNIIQFITSKNIIEKTANKDKQY